MILEKLGARFYEFGGFRLIPEERLLLRDDKPVALPPKVFDALLALVENHGHLIEKNDLLERLWADSFVEEATLARTISSLRKFLGENAKHKYIETVAKRGYRFIAPVRTLTEDEILSSAVLLDSESSGGEAKRQSAASKEKSENTIAPPKSSVSRPVLLVILIAFFGLAAVFFTALNRQNNPAKEIKSIAVLPFVNQSGSDDLEYLSDGITETLISRLSQLPNLQVKAHSSVIRYKGKDANAPDIGKEINVQAILTGRVVQRGDDLTLFLSLEDVPTGNRIWGNQYNRKMTNLVALQTEIARDVFDNLKTKLSGADERALAKNYTENAEAYQLYLRGRFHWNKRKTEDFYKAVGFYEQAVAVDPNYALAYAGIADAYVYLADYRSLPPFEAMPKAKEAALKAVALDDQLAEAHAALGHVLCDYDHNFAEAEARYKRAVELNPNYVTAHLYYAELHTWLGRFAEAEAEYRRALELEPFSLGVNWFYAYNLYHMRRYDESIAQAKKLLEMYPDFAWGHTILAFNYRMKGDYAGCVEEHAKSQEIFERPEQAAFMRESYAKGGWSGFLRAMTGERSPHNETSLIKTSYSAELDEKEKAFTQLEKLYDYRAWGIVTLKVEPALNPLRDDPRFHDLLRRVGFPP